MQYTEYFAQFFTATILDRNPLSIDLYTHDVFMQKLDYITLEPGEGRGVQLSGSV